MTQPRSLARQAFSGAAWLSVMNGLGGVAMLFLTWWLNRSLPDAPLKMGQWAIVLSLLLMTSLIFEGGLPAAIQQRRDLDPNALGALAWLQLALGATGALALAAMAPALARLMAAQSADEMTWLIRHTAPAVFTISAGLPAKALLQRDMKFRVVGSIEASSTFVMVALAMLGTRLVHFEPGHEVRVLVLAANVRYAVETVTYWAISTPPWRVLSHRDFRAAREPLRFGLAVGGTSILGTLARQGDTLLVGALLDVRYAGLYRQIQSLVMQPFAKLTTYVGRAAYSAFAKAQDDRARTCRGLVRMQRLLAFLEQPLLFGMAGVSPRLLAAFLGAQYAPYLPVAALAMKLLCLAAAVHSYTYTFNVVMNASGESRSVLLRQFAGVVTLVLGMAGGMPWGLPGIAFGRIVGLLVHGALLLSLAERLVGFGRAQLATSLKEALPASVACFTTATLVGAALTRAWPESALPGRGPALLAALAIQVAAGAAAYGIALLALRVDPRAELKALRT